MNIIDVAIKLLFDAWFGEQDSILVLGDFCEENNILFQELTNSNVEESLLSNHNDYECSGYGYGDGDKDDCIYYGDYYGDGFGYGYGDGSGKGFSNRCDDRAKEFYL